MDSFDPYQDLLGLDLPIERREEVLAAYRSILAQILKLRTLDLTELHPAVVFEPTIPYRMGGKP